MDKKTILFLLNKEATYLPPFLSILDGLSSDYSLKIISREDETDMARLLDLYSEKDVSFLTHALSHNKRTTLSRMRNAAKRVLGLPTKWHLDALQLIETTPHDLLWIIHEETAFEFRKILVGKKYIVSLYELNDHRRDFLDQLRPVLANAKEVLVPEYNRACILRVWLGLDKTPTVIPNKPLAHPRNRNIPNAFQEQLKGKKIILYQGYIQRTRNINTICEAVKEMSDYCVVLMGKGDNAYINELKHNYPQIVHIEFIAPPEHLYVTSWAHIAIVKYDFVYLNAIYCAPNKTWEYTGFGIPVLCHNIPGLEYTIGAYKAGVCTDLDNMDSVKDAIKKIDSNYDYYTQNALTFFDSCNIDSELHTVAQRNLNER